MVGFSATGLRYEVTLFIDKKQQRDVFFACLIDFCTKLVGPFIFIRLSSRLITSLGPAHSCYHYIKRRYTLAPPGECDGSIWAVAAMRRLLYSITLKSYRSHMAPDVFVPATPNPGSRTRPQPAIDHYGAVSTFRDDNICETCFSMLCTSCLELTTANCSQ